MHENNIGRFWLYYNQGRYQGGQNYVSEAETAMAEYLGTPFALGLNSGGSAIFLALKLAGVGETKTKIIDHIWCR